MQHPVATAEKPRPALAVTLAGATPGGQEIQQAESTSLHLHAVHSPAGSGICGSAVTMYSKHMGPCRHV